MKTHRLMPLDRAHDSKTIWVFTPSRTDPKDLEFILVQRQKLLQDAVERVKESALTDHKHHLLFVGPRGCGKTHLVTLIVNRLSGHDELTNHLRIAWLNEDETCTTLLEFLFKIHLALEKRYPDAYRSDMLSAAFDMKPHAALAFVSKHLLSTLGSHTLLVVAENLDAIFEGLGDAGQKQLRSFIQENPRLSILATAQRLVDDLSSRASPFFGFFQTEHLKPLNVEQATELLQNIARLQGKGSVVEFLSTSRGRSRVRAIHHLSGGNHRIYIVLSQFITRDSVDALLEPFMKMVDELTPYYQERIRWLPPMQRKIVEYLCICEGTVPVKEIAKRLFATPQTISSQLQDLREKGYVEANQRGRESLYEISEPLMRICVEVKDNQRLQPLRLLVDFLRVWYDDQDLKHRLRQMEPASASCAYLESAIQKNSVEGNLRKQILLEDFQSSLPEQLPSAIRDGMIQVLKNTSEGLLLAMHSIKDGKPAEAILYLDEAIAEEATPAPKVNLLLFRAQLHSSLGDLQRAIADFTAVIDLPGASVEQVAMALQNRGATHFLNSRKQESQADFEALIRLTEAPLKNVADAHLALSEIHFCEGRWGEGFQALEANLDFCSKTQLMHQGTATGLVGIIFSGGLNPEGRRDKVTELLRIYGKYQALPVLGEALVRHIGSVFRAGAPFPSTDNLEGWASAWEQAATMLPDFRLSMRLLRTGTDYVKAGGKDPGILLALTSPEHAILEQSLGLVEKHNTKTV
jgi:DNA-binding transcriptional ArsR family regulator